MSVFEKIEVKPELREKGYEIRVGSNIFKHFVEELVGLKPGCQVLLLTNDSIYDLYGLKIREMLTERGLEVLVYLVPDGEEYKSGKKRRNINNHVKCRFPPDGVVLALGGGLLAISRFCCCCLPTGIDLVQLPTAFGPG